MFSLLKQGDSNGMLLTWDSSYLSLCVLGDWAGFGRCCVVQPLWLCTAVHIPGCEDHKLH